MVSTDAASLLPSAKAWTRPRLRAAAIPGVVLAAAFTIRLALVWARVTPNYFPDEYLYTALGRSLASLDGVTVRGHGAGFPALLQPLLTAPAWRVGNVELGYRIVQTLGAAALTLAAVPAYLLTRALGLHRWIAVAVAALTLLIPDALYAGFVLAEPFAYPLVLGAVATGTLALARPSRRVALAFVLLVVLAAFARVQFLAVPLAWLVATAVVALRERALRRTLREQRIVLVSFGVLALAAAATGPARVLGYYSSVLHPHVHAGAMLDSLGRNALVLMYASGWILVPGALLGLALAITRPRSRIELAFAGFVIPLAGLLFLEAAAFGDTTLAQERYLFYLLPLAATAFGLYVSRGWPHRTAHGVLAAVLVTASVPFPLNGYARPDGMEHSPFLFAFHWLDSRLGPSTASVALAVAVAALAAVAVAASFRRRGAVLVFAVALVACAVSFAGAFVFDRDNSRYVARGFLPANHSWVDDAGIRTATLVTTFNDKVTDAEEQLFWNRSIQSVAVMPYGTVPDRMHVDLIRVRDDGTLTVAGRPLDGPLVMGNTAATPVFRNARRQAAAPHFTLWRPVGAPQLALYMIGRYWDGGLGSTGTLLAWPSRHGTRLAGWLEFDVRGAGPAGANFTLLQKGTRRKFVAPAGQSVRVRASVCSDRPWVAGFEAPPSRSSAGVFGQTATVPRFVADPRACPPVQSSS